MWLVVALVVSPACGRVETGCGGCGSALDSSSSEGCVRQSAFDPGFDFDAEPCTPIDASNLPPHEVVLFECSLACEPGFFDCDGVEANGCESAVACKGVEWLQTLSDAPLGLAVCGNELVYADGSHLMSTPIFGGQIRLIATLDQPPAGGVTCDNRFVYAPIRSVDGGRNGSVIGFSLFEFGPDAMTLASDADPARSIDLDDAGGVHWIARWDGGAFVVRSAPDASDRALLPVDEPEIYKTFALHEGLWAIAGNDLTHELEDGAVELLPDANAAAIVARSSGVTILTRTDAGPTLGSVPLSQARALASFGDDVFVATDRTLVHFPKSGPPELLFIDLAHVVDLAVDANYMYFTTTGPPAQLQRAPW